MIAADLNKCIVCGNKQHQGLSSWHFHCTNCKYESANLAGAINESATHELLDEGQRETALKKLRKASFAVIVDHAKRHVAGRDKKLLDVGSAHGWFLEEASSGYTVLGIEPDKAVYQKAAARGLNVRNGFFPDVLADDERFDVIIFNDVIEHIVEMGSALEKVEGHLNPGGILIINLPNSTGFFYRLSKVFKKIGLAGSFERMWQLGLPSPHVHYFNKENLDEMVKPRGFTLLENFELPSVRADGLLERIRCVGNINPIVAYFQYIAIRVAIPFLKLFPSDIIVSIYRKV